MIPAILKIYSDNESLMEYERSMSVNHCVSMDNISVRLMLMLRRSDMQMPDNYYEGICEEELSGIKSLSDLMLQVPLRIARKYILMKDRMLRVKGELFSEWMDVIVDVPPSLFIAAALLDEFHQQDTGPGTLRFAKQYLKPFEHTSLLPPFIPEFDYWINRAEGLEDLHIHLNGSTETDIVWRYILAHPYESTKLMKEKFQMRAVRKLTTIVTPNFNPKQFLDRLQEALRIKREMVRIISSHLLPGGSKLDELHHIWDDWSAQSHYGPMIDEILLYIYALNELRWGSDDYFASLFHHYLLIKGVVHRMVVMQHEQCGFEQFQSITTTPARNGVERDYLRRFLQLAGNGEHPVWSLMEGRFSPQDDVVKNQVLIRKIESGWEKSKDILEKEGRYAHNSKLALVAHFIKEPESNKSKKTFIRHSQLRNRLFRRAVALAEIRKNPHFAKLICGIDAAGSELDAGPEVFAPAFKYLRIKGVKHFTYHVGEDFRHLVSGLRAIAEAIQFLGLQRGDRLGHCVAVGIDPDLWMRRIKGECYLSQGEFLDDLVFVWDLIRNGYGKNLCNVQLGIESRIQELCHEIYSANYSPLELSKAWRMRKYDPYYYMNKYTTCSKYFKLEKGEEREEVESKFEDQTLSVLMQKYHASSEDTFYRNCRINYDKKIKVRVGEILSVELLKEIQSILLRDIVRKEIVIEALPSSNLRIGYYKTMEEYHLTKWVNGEFDDSLPPIVLGTDDPGVFMTNIYNEYARVFCHLKNRTNSLMDKMGIISRIYETSKIYHFCD